MPIKDPEARAEYRRKRAADLERLRVPPAAAEPPSAAEAVADVVRRWSKERLLVPAGPLAGQPFMIDDWQYDFLVDALALGIREAGLSVARKNGKSGLIAALFLCYLVGPLNVPNWRGIVVSLTGELAKELRNACQEIAEASDLPGVRIIRSPTPGGIEGDNGARLRILAADRSSGHAIGADLVVIDEAGLLDEAKRDLWNACLSSVSGRDGQLLCISVQGFGPMFKELRGRKGHRAVAWHEYSCEPDVDLTDAEQWHQANPGLATGIKSLSYMQDMAERAAATPADARAFRTLDLNSPGSPSQDVIVDVGDWRQCVVDDVPAATGPCYVGLDLGGARSFTGAAAYYPETYRLDVWASVGGNPTLEQRGQFDGVAGLYVTQRDRGELTVHEGFRETPVEPFLLDAAERLDGVAIRGIAADRYKQATVQDALEQAKLRPWLRWLDWRGQGYRDGAEDVVAFQKAVYGGRIRIGRNLLLETAIMESMLAYDEAGNAKLDKRRHRGRIDALSAAVLAVSMGERNRKTRPSGPLRTADRLMSGCTDARRTACGSRSARRCSGADGRRCQQCGKAGRLEAHHVLPLEEGGQNDLENLSTLCRGCHIEVHKRGGIAAGSRVARDGGRAALGRG